MGGSIPRDPVRQQKAVFERLDELSSRISRAIPGRLTDLGRGSTAERDVLYGVPTATADQVALANRNIVWFNTDKGWSETYFSPAAAGLTARALIAGNPAGWYPLAGTHMVATRIKNNGFQSVPAGSAVLPTLTIWLNNVGGFTVFGTSGMAAPIGGYYEVTSGVYWSGGGAMVYRNNVVRYAGPGGVINEVAGSRMPNTGADGQNMTSTPGVPFIATQAVELVAQCAGADNVYGDGVNRRTFLAMKYEGPPVAA